MVFSVNLDHLGPSIVKQLPDVIVFRFDKRESKKESKKKRKKKEMKGKRDDKEGEEGTNQESQGSPEGTLLDPTKLTPLTSRNESSLDNLHQDGNINRASLDLEEATSSSQQINSQFKTKTTIAYNYQTLRR